MSNQWDCHSHAERRIRQTDGEVLISSRAIVLDDGHDSLPDDEADWREQECANWRKRMCEHKDGRRQRGDHGAMDCGAGERSASVASRDELSEYMSALSTHRPVIQRVV